MAEPSDVVGRADSLMRRRRSFVAQPPRPPEIVVASPPPAASDDDDLPVLTEVVSADAAVSGEPSDRFDETEVSLLASDLTHSIGQQLSGELPALLEAALLNAGEKLRSGIDAIMENALRDFIARRKQLRLPLDEPNRGEH